MQRSEAQVAEVSGYRFGVFQLDVKTLELSKSGRPVKLRPQSLKVLALLLARPGELVTRADLKGELWDRDTFVDYEQGVNHCIKELRAALGDVAESPRFIETLARRGYRFIAPVERVSAPSSDLESHVETVGPSADAVRSHTAAPVPHEAAPKLNLTAGLILIGVTLVAVAGLAIGLYPRRSAIADNPGIRIVSVLPFAVAEGDQALGAGLANAISQRLGGQQMFAVRSQTRGDGAHESAGGTQSGPGEPTLILDGEISRAGSTVTVDARLKSALDDLVLWSERFRVKTDDLFSVEDVIAERVVTALGLRLAAAEQDRLRRRYTGNTSAYEDYLRGRAAMNRYTPDGTREAVSAFERALQRDPDYALARAGLAMACADMCLRFAPAGEVERWGARSEEEARQALELDPDLAEAHLARAAVARKREFDWNATAAASRRAILLNPNLDQAHFFMAAAYYHLGYMEEALIEAQKGRALHGGDIVEPIRIEALVALFSGDFAPAVARLEEVSRLSSQAIGDTYLALALYYSGSRDRARTVLETLSTHSSLTTATRSRAALAGVLAAHGQTDAARSHIQQVVDGRYRDHHVAYSLGVAYAQLADFNQSVQWLRTAADTGFPCLPWFERDPLLEPARRRSDFAELMAYVRVRRDAALAKVD
jgi:DNA-binding winged helix-turn-helix (wHTH) protein/TolB-like protein/Flp pilus assembly protein TadD